VQISPIRDAIATAARAVVLPSGLGKLTATGYLPDSIVAPHFAVCEVEVTFDKTFGRGTDSLELTTRAFVGRADDRAAQRTLDALLSGGGPTSLKAAIEVARGGPGEMALGGLADDLHVMRVQGYRWFEFGTATYLGAEFIIKVIGDGSS
jgi:hypothetical protein